MSAEARERQALRRASGLAYHWRALRYSEHLWASFRWPLGEWLLGWQPPESTLLLVGPSAGYNLQPFLLERFEQVVVLEPDALAHALLRYRLWRVPLERRPRLRFISRDHLMTHPERLAPLLTELKDTAILFCNALGQLRYLLDTDELDGAAAAAVRSAVRDAIRGRSWASFHDRVSGAIAPTVEEPALAERRLTDAELIEAAYYSGGDAVSATLFEHGVRGFFPEDLPHLYLRWEIQPGTFHLIEAVRQVRGEPSAAAPLLPAEPV